MSTASFNNLYLISVDNGQNWKTLNSPTANPSNLVIGTTFGITLNDGDASEDPWIIGESLTVSGVAGITTLYYRGYSTQTGDSKNPSGGFYLTANANGTGTTYFITNDNLATLNPSGSANLGKMTFANDPNGGVVPCFFQGIRISTPRGDLAVETLRKGDLVNTSAGPKQIYFVARYSIPVQSSDAECLPICIAKSAFGANVPNADLLLSPGHAVYFQGILIHASVLVNGSTISALSRDDLREAIWITYYNIELEGHELLTAHNLTVESYYDSVPRDSWDNYIEYLTVYGEERVLSELTLPRIQFSRQMPNALRESLAKLSHQLVH